jgi:hypothetical protein
MATQSLAAQYREAQAATLVPTILKTITKVRRATGTVVLLAMAVSYLHQVHFLTDLGAGYFAYVIPLVFDTMIYLCLKVTQTVGLTADAKRAAMKSLVGFVSVSMLINALAPADVALRIIIVLVVAAIAVAEWVGSKIKPDFDALEAAEIAITPAAPKKTLSAETIAKRNATRAANKAAKMTPAAKRAATLAARKAEAAALQAQYDLEAAPVSPAPYGS